MIKTEKTKEIKNNLEPRLIENHWFNFVLMLIGLLLGSLLDFGEGIISMLIMASIPPILLIVTHTIIFFKWWDNKFFWKIFFTGRYKSNGEALRTISLSSLIFIFIYVLAAFAVSFGVLEGLRSFDFYVKVNVLLTSRGDDEAITKIITSVTNIIVNTVAMLIFYSVFNISFKLLVSKGIIRIGNEFKKQKIEEPKEQVNKDEKIEEPKEQVNKDEKIEKTKEQDQ